MPTINFYTNNNYYYDIFDPPVPAKKIIPEWYKETPNWVDNKPDIFTDEGNPLHTLKHCMPLFDSMTMGYFWCLPTDIYISRSLEDNNVPSFIWHDKGYSHIRGHYKGQEGNLPIPSDYYPYLYKFSQEWVCKTPPGYSTLFVQPFFETESPFKIFSGVVDTDTYPLPVNFPFLLKKNSFGEYKTGLPLVQIIPFKRDKWSSNKGLILEEYNKSWERALRQFSHRYKTFFRKEKRWD